MHLERLELDTEAAFDELDRAFEARATGQELQITEMITFSKDDLLNADEWDMDAEPLTAALKRYLERTGRTHATVMRTTYYD